MHGFVLYAVLRGVRSSALLRVTGHGESDHNLQVHHSATCIGTSKNDTGVSKAPKTDS